MGETITNFDSYVNGYKVVNADALTVTLENGVTVKQINCKLVSVDEIAGTTYYRHEDEE